MLDGPEAPAVLVDASLQALGQRIAVGPRRKRQQKCDDFRIGRATTIVIALAAYGTAMLIIARRRTPRSILKENA